MKTFSNLYSAIKHGRNIIIRPKWKPNVPGHNYYVSKNGRVYRYLGDFKWVRISVYSDGKPDSYLKCKIDLKSWLLHRLVATIYLPNTELDNTLQAWFDGCLPTPNKIIYYNDVHNLYNQGLSVREIANILPIHISSVRRILKGKGLIKYKDKFCYVNKQQK